MFWFWLSSMEEPCNGNCCWQSYVVVVLRGRWLLWVVAGCVRRDEPTLEWAVLPILLIIVTLALGRHGEREYSLSQREVTRWAAPRLLQCWQYWHGMQWMLINVQSVSIHQTSLHHIHNLAHPLTSDNRIFGDYHHTCEDPKPKIVEFRRSSGHILPFLW